MDEEGVKIKINKTEVYEETPVDEFSSVGTETNRATGGVSRLAGRLARFQFGLMTLPLNLLPARTRYHAKNSLREGILAMKTLVDEVANGVEQGINYSRERDKIPPADKVSPGYSSQEEY